MHPVKNIEEGETEREEVPDILKKKVEEENFANFLWDLFRKKEDLK